MTRSRTARSLGLLAGGLVMGLLAGCGGSGTSNAGCSSCQEAYTEEQCQAWGARAGCKAATTTLAQTCATGIAGCAFKDCAGPSICDDTGEASCATCKGDYTQADCDGFGAAAGCSSAQTSSVTACGIPATACDFTGCDFRPSC